MIVFVDYEHAEGQASAWGEKLLAARTWITYRLEDLSGLPCMLVRYDRLTTELLDHLDAKAIFISGNGTDPSRYADADIHRLHQILRTTELPMFGFCGGFQCIAQALGSSLRSIDTPDGLDNPRLSPFGEDALGELGYMSVDLLSEHPLLDGIDPEPVVRHAHRLEVPTPPPGFRVLASSPISAVQMAVNDERRIVGTQFHPEYYTDEHPAGRAMIKNFLRWASIT